VKVPVRIVVEGLGRDIPAWAHVVPVAGGVILEIGPEDRAMWISKLFVEGRDAAWLSLAVASLSRAPDAPASFPGSNLAVPEGVPVVPGSDDLGPSCLWPVDAVSSPEGVKGGGRPPSSLLDATRRTDTKT